MRFDIVDLTYLTLIMIGAIIGVIALAVLRLKVEQDKKKEYKKYNSFLIMGVSWFIVGLFFNLYDLVYRGTWEIGVLTSLGLIFLLAGSIGVITEYLRIQEILEGNLNGN
ncbi:MAG: hypothetical protein ACFFCD_10985 [Promethearchaeota archaeon]